MSGLNDSGGPQSSALTSDASGLAELQGLLRAALGKCTRVLAVTGAGISTSAGIPDFRSPTDGLYSIIQRSTALSARLSEPQELFDVEIFKTEPELLFASGVAAALLSSLATAQPTRCHKLLAGLEQQGVLLRQYTQNIDCLEVAAGVSKLVQAHGTLATATCLCCKRQVPAAAIEADVRARCVPRCMDTAKCRKSRAAVFKPDVVFFREALPATFFAHADADTAAADALLIIGSSMKVKPVADFPRRVAPEAPVIVINRDPLPGVQAQRGAAVVTLLGDCDAVMSFVVDTVWPEAGRACPPPATGLAYTVTPCGAHTWRVVATTSSGEPVSFAPAGGAGAAAGALALLCGGADDASASTADAAPFVTRSGRATKRTRWTE